MASVPTWGVADITHPGPTPTRREDTVDTLHGIDVPDPYRWLEVGESPEVGQWVAQQNQHTRQALDARPDRERWHERLSALVALPTVLSCAVRHDRLFVLERGAGADQFALVLRSSTDSSVEPRLLLDPAAMAADGAVAIDWYHPNDDGSLVAVGLSEGGTEDSILHLIDVADGRLQPLRIPDTRAASVAWHPDGTGFWYTRYPTGDHYRRHIRWHLLGADPADDPVVFDRLPTPESWPDVQVSADGQHVLVEMSVGWSRSDAHLLHVPSATWHTVVEGADAVTSLRFASGGLIGHTTVEAPNGRVVGVSLDEPGVANWVTVVPERSDVVVGGVVAVADELLVVSSRSAVDTVERWTSDGRAIGVVDGLGVVAVGQLTSDREAGVAFVVVSSFDAPTCVWRYESGSIGRWAPEPPSADAVVSLVVEQCSYPSLDGTEIGLFVIRRADVVPGPAVPLILNGYGGFAITESPQWVPNLAAWCAQGGVWAIAGLRGGYEHGERWHHAGRRATKQNVFDDFHSAGDWLVAQGMASHERMALVGGSNGGLLVGAALTQRPDLARAVWCAVPLLDMVRFPQFLIARLWTDEYGDPDVAEEFGWLYAYSPYHAVEHGTAYPSVLFTTAEGDTRVDPLHARKMAAMLQHAAERHDDRPVLLLQSGRAGHGVGKPSSMRVAEGVDVLAFMSWQLGGMPA
ncbi:MAG: prolyl oligopeptidase family serine peptidase [Ilumatobacteraceae bacterium]